MRIAGNRITFTVKAKDKNKPQISGFINNSLVGGNTCEVSINKNKVFMIRYKSGMRDIVTPFEKEEEVVVEEQTQETEPQYKVVFHAVTGRECLNDISDKYGVTPAQIIEWNELPAKTKYTTPLTSGMQLMIYQPTTK